MSKWLKNLWSFVSGKNSWGANFDTACKKFQTGDHEQAEESFRIARALAENSGDTARLFTTLVCMASCLRVQGKFAESKELLETALALKETGAPLDDMAYAHKELGVCLYEFGEPSEAEPPLRKAIGIYATMNKQEEEETADCEFFLARALILQCKFEEALLPLEHSLGVYNRSKENRVAEIADTLHCQAVVWNRLEEFEKAEANLVVSTPMHKELFGKASLEVARCTTEWATAVLSQGRYHEAADLLNASVDALKQIGAGDTVDFADSLTALGTCCRMQRRLDEGIQYYREALSIYEQEGTGDHCDIAAVLTQLAICYTEREEVDTAEDYFRKALDVTEHGDRPNPAIYADNLYSLAKCCVFQQRYGEAVSLYKKALALVENSFGSDHCSVAPVLTELAYCYQLQERISEAKPLYQRALEIHESGKAQDDDLADNLIGLANCYLETGEYARARPLYQRALHYKQFKFDPRDQDLVSRIEDLLQQMEEHAAAGWIPGPV